MLIIVGSRRNGNSLALAEYVKKELAEDRIHAEIIVPGNQRIHLCTGCMDCDESGVCDFTDDMKMEYRKDPQRRHLDVHNAYEMEFVIGRFEDFYG